ncbi:hypothetical protein [Streptomyces sp. SID3343]|uniref:hypothetical protein n=1 Tax=Streptomyces sp. SID3343 TaxID=2690260 RepID=UPI001368A506|nr:hypothetical protein [Streptomyces sp. SID3343]MYV98758.1 hypothetical protein [Streptomyces sp. SID3343]
MAPVPSTEVSIGVHPRFGIVALTTDAAPSLAVRLLALAGFDAVGVGPAPPAGSRRPARHR